MFYSAFAYSCVIGVDRISFKHNLEFFHSYFSRRFLHIDISDLPASGLYFLSYEYVKDYAGKNFGTEGSTGLIGTIMAGGAAGLGYWAVGMPGTISFNLFEFFVSSIF